MWHRQPLVSRANHVAGSDRLRLSLCMIVRDNEGTLPACLAGIRPWVDEIVIVDTGTAGGCGCATGAAGGWWLGLLALAVGRRARRAA